MPKLTIPLSIRGKRWFARLTQPHELEDGDPDFDTEGDCDCGTQRIRVSLALSPKRFVYVWIHETLHACLPDLDEQTVVEVANAITNGLWKLTWIWNPAWRIYATHENRDRQRS